MELDYISEIITIPYLYTLCKENIFYRDLKIFIHKRHTAYLSHLVLIPTFDYH